MIILAEWGIGFMELREILDMKRLQALQDDFSEIAGLKAIVVGKNGEYLTDGRGFRGEGDTVSMDVYVQDEKAGAVIAEASSDKKAKKAAEMFGQQVNFFANIEYMRRSDPGKLDAVKEDIRKSGELVQTINEKTGHLKGIAKKQTILSLNATIEAARSGEAGVGFAVVAKSMQDLSGQSAGIYNDIEKSVEEITNLINSIITAMG